MVRNFRFGGGRKDLCAQGSSSAVGSFREVSADMGRRASAIPVCPRTAQELLEGMFTIRHRRPPVGFGTRQSNAEVQRSRSQRD